MGGGPYGPGFFEGLMGQLGPALDRKHEEQEKGKAELRKIYLEQLFSGRLTTPEARQQVTNELKKLMPGKEGKNVLERLGGIVQKVHGMQRVLPGPQSKGQDGPMSGDFQLDEIRRKAQQDGATTPPFAPGSDPRKGMQGARRVLPGPGGTNLDVLGQVAGTVPSPDEIARKESAQKLDLFKAEKEVEEPFDIAKERRQHEAKMEEIKATAESRGDKVLRSWTGDDGKEHILMHRADGTEVEEIHGGVRATGTYAGVVQASKDMESSDPAKARAGEAFFRSQLAKQYGSGTLGQIRGALAMQKSGSPEDQQAATMFLQLQKARAQAAMQNAQLGGKIDPEVMDFWGGMMLATGQQPSFGWGASGNAARLQLLTHAAKMAKESGMGPGDVAAARANITAAKTELTKLKSMKGAVEAFSTTGKANLDLFISKADKVVETGSPLANKVFRGGAREIFGSGPQAEFDAARVVAFTEIARVVANPNLAGVLSDNARQEMQPILSGSYTADMLARVAKVIKQDMDNRGAGLKTAIEDAEKDIQAVGGQFSPAARKLPSPSTEAPSKGKIKILSVE